MSKHRGFKPIPGFERYIINKNGTIISLITGRIKKQWINTHGYWTVGLQSTNPVKTRTLKVHTLIAISFLGKRPDGFDVCHIDGNQLNNRLSNITYASRLDNIRDKHRHKTMAWGEKINTSKLTVKDVLNIRKDFIKYHRTKSNCRALAEKYGVTKETICNVISRKTWNNAELDKILGGTSDTNPLP